MASADFKVKHGLSVAGNTTLEGTVTTSGVVLPNTTSPITLNGSDGTSGQVLTSAGSGATPTWTAVGGGSSTLDGLTDVTITTPTDGEILVYDGAEWVNSPALGAREVFAATASQTVFTLVNSYVVGSGQLSVYINGVKQYPVTYTETSTTSFTLSEAAVAGDQVMAEISLLTSNYVQPTATFALDELTDVSITTPTAGQGLSYNGTTWVNSASSSVITHNVASINLYGPAGTTGASYNTVYGIDALPSGGSSNVVIGYSALGAATSGYDNVAVGFRAMYHTTTGNDNVAIGADSLFTNSTGANNTAVGSNSMLNSTTGDDNVAVGSNSLFYISGHDNVAVGIRALYYTTTGVNNTAVGSQAGYNNTLGSNNIVVGEGAGYNLTTGSNNTLIGGYAGTAGMDGHVVLSTGDGTVRLQHDGTLWTSTTPISVTGYVKTVATTVSGLTAAATAGAGARAFVTDATATTFLSVVAGGGGNSVPVVSDGTNWLVG